MAFKVVVYRQNTNTDKFFLQNLHKVKEVLRLVVAYIIYFVRRNRQTIFSVLAFWGFHHDTHYTLYDVIYIRKIALTITIVEDLYCLTLQQFVSKIKVCHVGTTGRTVNGKKAKTR